MGERIALSKKLRFEVFKRDSFTCQYCGRSAPDVLLHADHIRPISKLGGNDIMNLITSCADCNSGKGPRELGDESVLQKQRAQLDELNERRLQLEMMLEWREGLQGLRDRQVEIILEAFREKTFYVAPLDEQSEADVEKWLKKFDVRELLDAIDQATTQYLEFDEEEGGRPTNDSMNKAFSYIPRIASVARRPDERQLYYIHGILKNRLHYHDPRVCLSLLKEAYEKGASLDWLTDLAKDVRIRNWAQWRAAIDDFIARASDGHGDASPT